jgi:hypothetical protein
MGAGSGMQQSFNNADKVMSEANSNDGISGATDAPVAEASVNAHGSGIGAAILSAYVQQIEADARLRRWAIEKGHDMEAERAQSRISAFISAMHIVVDKMANAATSTQESGKTTS